MEIQKVTDTAFAKYGKVMSDIPVERRFRLGIVMGEM